MSSSWVELRTSDGELSLVVGSNVITVEVTAEDGRDYSDIHRNGYQSRAALDGRHAQRFDAEWHRFRHLRLRHHLLRRPGCQQRDSDDGHSNRE